MKLEDVPKADPERQIWTPVLVREDQYNELDPPLGLESAFRSSLTNLVMYYVQDCWVGGWWGEGTRRMTFVGATKGTCMISIRRDKGITNHTYEQRR
jgi:hypothetical protein